MQSPYIFYTEKYKDWLKCFYKITCAQKDKSKTRTEELLFIYDINKKIYIIDDKEYIDKWNDHTPELKYFYRQYIVLTKNTFRWDMKDNLWDEGIAQYYFEIHHFIKYILDNKQD